MPIIIALALGRAHSFCRGSPVSASADPPVASAAEGFTRRAVVAVADLVGYSIIMSTDGELTHTRWMAFLNESLRPLASVHGSSFLKSTGDGVVVEFATADDGFAWAMAVQQAARAVNQISLPPIAFRIAIECGDLCTPGDDIYGVAINVAARLQEVAPPGGIALTRTGLGALSVLPRCAN